MPDADVKGLLNRLDRLIGGHTILDNYHDPQECLRCRFNCLRAAVGGHHLPVDWQTLIDERDKAERERDELRKGSGKLYHPEKEMYEGRGFARGILHGESERMELKKRLRDGGMSLWRQQWLDERQRCEKKIEENIELKRQIERGGPTAEKFDELKRRLEGALIDLTASVDLQSHYAGLLNQYDGGKRIQFKTAQEWTTRCLALREGQQ